MTQATQKNQVNEKKAQGSKVIRGKKQQTVADPCQLLYG
jgi:hypothetical protein